MKLEPVVEGRRWLLQGEQDLNEVIDFVKSRGAF